MKGEQVSITEDGHAVSMLEIEPHGEPGPGEKRLADKLGDSFTLQVEIPQVGAVKGRWVLQIPVQKQGMYTAKQTPMLEKKLGNITMLMRSVASSPRGIELNFHTILPANDKKAGETFLGMAFTATDEHGYPLDEMGGEGNMYGDETIWETTLSYSPLPESSKEIVLKPYRSLGKEGAGYGQSETELASLPLTVEQGAIGKATVRKLEKLNEKTVLHYEVSGPLPGDQAGGIGLVQNGKALERKSLKLVGKMEKRIHTCKSSRRWIKSCPFV